LNVKSVEREEITSVSDAEQRGWKSIARQYQEKIVRVCLDPLIDRQLALEGEAREIVRAVQEGRKKAGFEVSDRIILGFIGKEAVFDGDMVEGIPGFGETIARETLATEIRNGDVADPEYRGIADIDGERFVFTLTRNGVRN
jgi:isoleucyl-tRNA synthetase